MTAPICDICFKPKVLLAERTEQTHEAIYVCAEKLPKQKMPCDGWIAKIASRRT